MAEENGGTSGEGKTYTQAEMDASLTEAKATGNKEGQTAAHAHWQSVSNKATAQLTKEYEGKFEQASSVIADLRKAQLDTMDPGERSVAMMQQLMEKIDGKGANDASDKSNPFDRTAESQQDKVPGQDQQAAVAQSREAMGNMLKNDYGIDPTKLDWAEGESDDTAAMKKFMGSFATALKAVGTEKPGEDQNKVDTSNQPGGDTFDLNTSDPKDLIRNGAGRVRPGMNNGGYETAPWL